jgi:hypothetical protein
MKKLIPAFLIFACYTCNTGLAQSSLTGRVDTLPKFFLKDMGNNRIVIGWVNNYPDIRQISIQRSFDSLLNYKTILTVPDPAAIQNGYMDAKATNDHMFYRLYILLDKGVYLFSAAKKPARDSLRKTNPVLANGDYYFGDTKKPMLDSLRKNNPFLIDRNQPHGIADTVLVNGKLVVVAARPVVIKINSLQWGDSVAVPNPDYIKPVSNTFTPSLYVYTFRDGYVRISLPESEKLKKYSIKFFDDKGNFLFELKDMKEKDFKLDKTNFYHSGWFRFENFS